MDFQNPAPYRVIRKILGSNDLIRVPVNARSMIIRTLVGPGWLPVQLNDPDNPVIICQHNTVFNTPVRDVYIDLSKIQVDSGSVEFLISDLPEFPFVLPPDGANFHKTVDATASTYVFESLPVQLFFTGSGDVTIQTGTVDSQTATFSVTPGKILYDVRGVNISGAGANFVVSYADPYWRDGASLFV